MTQLPMLLMKQLSASFAKSGEESQDAAVCSCPLLVKVAEIFTILTTTAGTDLSRGGYAAFRED